MAVQLNTVWGAKLSRASLSAVATAIITTVAACGGHSSQSESERSVGGRAVGEVFSDPNTAALARTACEGDGVALRLALESGADLNGRGHQGVTPLIWAQNCENIDGMRALLEAGADPNVLTSGRGAFSAVTIAAGMPPSFLALLLEHGGDPDAVYGDSPNTALSIAFQRGVIEQDWDNYYMLLSAGADINRVYGGITIAELAASLNQYDKVVELLERGYTQRLARLGLRAQNAQVAILPIGQRSGTKVQSALSKCAVCDFP